MSKQLAALGWIIAIIAIGTSAGLFVALKGEKVKVIATQSEVEKLETISKGTEERITYLQAKMEEMNEQLMETAAQLEEAKKASANPAASASPQNPMASLFAGLGKQAGGAGGEGGKNPMSSLADLLKGAGKGAGKDGADSGNPLEGISSMFEGEQGKKLAEYGARMNIGMMYQDLFTDLALPSDVEGQVRDILAKNMADQVQNAMGMLTGKDAGGKEADLEKQYADKVRQELSAVLSPEEMAKWEAYEANKDQHAMNAAYDMQLNMFAPSLSPEAHQMARDVLVEEMLAANANEAQTGSGKFSEEAIAAQAAAMQRVRDRLVNQLDESQYTQVDQFLRQQEELVQMFLQMTGENDANNAGNSQTPANN